MQKFLTATCAAVAAISICMNSAFAATVADVHHWKPMFVVSAPRHAPMAPALLDRLAAIGATVPFWSASVKSPLDHRTYTMTMVGSSPLATAKTTTISYVPIVVKVNYGGGVVLDPTKAGCGDAMSVANRFLGSPVFQPVNVSSNGVNVGPAQLTDAFQRANFWKLIKGSPNYHIVLASALKTPIVVTVNAPPGAQLYGGACAGSNHSVGAVDYNAWDIIVQTLINTYAKPNQLPLVITYNTFQYEGTPANCCVLGYHGDYPRSSGEQTYAVGAYSDAGIFSVPIEDIHAWTHELGEWLDDPFVGNFSTVNTTPAWGNIGQVSGCQNNLEVGDPLTGTPYAVTAGGFAYHPQELVFATWFYRYGSTGTGGKQSFEGTFTAGQPAVCH